MFIIYERTLLSTNFVAWKRARVCDCPHASFKVLGFQRLRTEDRCRALLREPSELKWEGRTSGCDHQTAPFAKEAWSSLLLLATNGGVASHATGRENEPTKRLRMQPLPKRVSLLAGPQRVHAPLRPQLRRYFQWRQPYL